jgi:hypothetical protein
MVLLLLGGAVEEKSKGQEQGRCDPAGQCQIGRMCGNPVPELFHEMPPLFFRRRVVFLGYDARLFLLRLP